MRLSHPCAAQARAKEGLEKRAVSSACDLFHVSHEGGLGVVLWSLGIEPLGMPEPDLYLRDSRHLPGLMNGVPPPPDFLDAAAGHRRGRGRARSFRNMTDVPIAVHRAGRGNEYASFERIHEVIAAAVNSGADPKRARLVRGQRGEAALRAPPPVGEYHPFGPEDC